MEKLGKDGLSSSPSNQIIDYYQSPLGPIKITEADGKIVRLDYVEELKSGEHTALTHKVKTQLEAYFRGEEVQWDFPYEARGTEFQEKVWAALERIPYGETRTYGEIAREVGSPKGARAVGGANGKNPISIVIPCHRVTAALGKLGGYTGGVEKKKFLLELESKD